jgi:hypothetical protein
MEARPLMAKKKTAPAGKPAEKPKPKPKSKSRPKPKPKPKAKAVAPGTEFTVRMFCHGLGDCFLLSIPQGKSQGDYWILIDCGIAMNTKDQEAIMDSVVGEIRELTGGRIDLLVVTHEHWDHVSGFGQAASRFENEFTFEHLWLAWTENESDPVAKELRKKKKKARLALELAHARLTGLAGDDQDAVNRLKGMSGPLAFFGPSAAAAKSAADGSGNKLTIEEAMDAASAYVKASGGQIDTLMPGTVEALPSAEGGLAGKVRAFVLGPPHDATQVRRTDPRKGEAYEKKGKSHFSFSTGASWSWSRALTGLTENPDVGGLSPGGKNDPSQPFEANYRIPLETALESDFFQERYAAPQAGSGRRIDGDWLWSGAEQLALHLDNATNNTSLVLAFELPVSRRVLLFVGDAQAGNWRSWHEHSFDRGDGGAPVTATDLLGRTVLYKVGHHGSHNATLKPNGLELMTHRDLVALVPVHRDAVERLGYGEMPLESLMTRLGELCAGRVFRSDDLAAQGAEIGGTWPRHLEKPKLRAVKGSNPPVSYLEYSVRDTK